MLERSSSLVPALFDTLVRKAQPVGIKEGRDCKEAAHLNFLHSVSNLTT